MKKKWKKLYYATNIYFYCIYDIKIEIGISFVMFVFQTFEYSSLNKCHWWINAM